ncbi:MAG TPA: aroma-sacti cluster domain-containing protein [Mycobacteriales bacterium]|jgi:hypothetical protein
MSDVGEQPESAAGREVLRSLGLEMGELDEAQREVLDHLTDEEVTVLLEVRRRLLDAEPEVSAHTTPLTIGGLFF